MVMVALPTHAPSLRAGAQDLLSLSLGNYDILYKHGQLFGLLNSFCFPLPVARHVQMIVLFTWFCGCKW